MLVLVAALSFIISESRDHFMRASFSSLPMAIAKDARVTGDLEMFLKIDGISGDSVDQDHKGEIAVDSYAWEESRPMAAQKPTMQVFTVTLPAGRASPKLFLHVAGGVKISRAVLSVRRKGGNQDFIKWTLTDTVISSYKTVGNTRGDGIAEQISFTFGKIETLFVPDDGSVAQKAGWDLRTGKSVGN